MPEARVSLLYLSGVLFRTSCKMCVDTRSTAAATLRASFSLNVNSEAFLKEINACPYIFAFSCKQPNNGLNIKNELFAIVLLYLSLFWLYSITALASRIASLYRPILVNSFLVVFHCWISLDSCAQLFQPKFGGIRVVSLGKKICSLLFN